MTVATISVPDLPAALRARDHGMALAEDGQSAEQDRYVIDNAIRHFAGLGDEFSSNDVRRVLPVVSGSLIGSRFLAAHKRGEIERVGDELADHEAGHARRISVWRKATGSKPIANGKQVAKQSASGNAVTPAVTNPVTPDQEATIRRAHWALADKGGVRNTGDARQIIRSLLDVLGAVTGTNSTPDELF